MNAKDFSLTTDYAADDLTHLEGLEAVRKRPGMYIGSTGSRGIGHLAAEIIDNSTDEAVAGHGTLVAVTLHPDGSVEVADQARGIPTGINTKTNMSGVQMALTLLHAGGKFGGSGYKASGGLHGVGSAVVNGLSSRLDVTVRQHGELHQMSFQHGGPGVFAGPGPAAAFTPGGGLRVVGKMRRGDRTGTVIRYWHDPRFFDEDAILDVEVLTEKLRRSAFLVPGVTYTLSDLRQGPKTVPAEFCFPGGLKEMVEYLAPDAAVCAPVMIVGEGVYKENAADENGVMQSGVERRMEVEIALRWGAGYDTTVQCFTNTIPNAHGGTHRKGFDRALTRALGEAIKNTRGLLKAKEDAPIAEDFAEGLTAVIHVRVPEPQFTSQTKDELATAGVAKALQSVAEQGLKGWVGGRSTKTEARVVLGKIMDAARVRLAQKSQKDTARRKTALEGAAMPSKLVDCRTTGVDRSELLIVEGDSALGSARKGRISEYQALLPIRGKILNVQKASLADMLKNAECTSIIQTIGAGSGRTFDVDLMRYRRIILMADADIDGSHIRCLLATFFLKYMRPMVEAGMLYAAMPPLHKITVKGKQPETIFTYSEAQMQATVKALTAKGRQVVTPVPRFKGLGEMDAGELWETTMNPATRSVRRITVADAEAADAAVELTMGNRVEPRRDWLLASSELVDHDNLDT